MGATSEAAEQGQARRAKPASAPRPPRRRLTVDRRRQELIDAALWLFSEHDAENVSIDDVAAAAGASRALVYHYFGGKHELYLAALKNAAEQLEERLRMVEGGRPLDALASGLGRYFDFVEEHATGFAALLRGGPANRSGEVGEIAEGVRRFLLRLIMEKTGVTEPGPLLRITLRSWIASVETAGLDWLEHRDIDRPSLERLLVDQMLALLTAAAHQDPAIQRILPA
ncbi:TetR/AcrR family transcriptional regulator [Spongiactinospora sp. TRM90649]|uniref:TetR/AcrR family transcriptional regulator n=1 Tax=Spongiactinospora sp. TRM90649 TaxID=3031114 RepID=UPI0023F93AD8|nr:TetR/AcrR family transcriptional regulator [Spongiactinospora sp. TRM90649]MDF5754471.1 TetR/AcrR family transcriptional regulator [Spongiactinospora sp. TRM90649]